MELTNEELFKQALKDSFTRKIQSRIDSCTEEIIYSPKHIKVMSAILEGRGYHINRASTKKKIAAILIAAALLLLTACSIIYYEEINGFFINVKEHGIAIWFEKESDQNRFIEEVYEFTYIPEGFYLAKETTSPLSVEYQYKNTKKDYINITQTTLNGVNGVDSERGDDMYIYIDSKYIYIRNIDSSNYYLWRDDKYVIRIITTIELSIEELELIIQGIKVK